MEISDRLTDYVHRTFAADDARSLLAALEHIETEVFGLQDPERCALSIVLLVQDGAHPADAVRLARTDWRDLLVAAELANSDWPQRAEAVLDPPDPTADPANSDWPQRAEAVLDPPDPATRTGRTPSSPPSRPPRSAAPRGRNRRRA